MARSHFVDIVVDHRDWAALADFAVRIANFANIVVAHTSAAVVDCIGYMVLVDIVMAVFVDSAAANTDQKEEAYSSSEQAWARADYHNRHKNGCPPRFACHRCCKTP